MAAAAAHHAVAKAQLHRVLAMAGANIHEVPQAARSMSAASRQQVIRELLTVISGPVPSYKMQPFQAQGWRTALQAFECMVDTRHEDSFLSQLMQPVLLDAMQGLLPRWTKELCLATIEVDPGNDHRSLSFVLHFFARLAASSYDRQLALGSRSGLLAEIFRFFSYHELLREKAVGLSPYVAAGALGNLLGRVKQNRAAVLSIGGIQVACDFFRAATDYPFVKRPGAAEIAVAAVVVLINMLQNNEPEGPAQAGEELPYMRLKASIAPYGQVWPSFEPLLDRLVALITNRRVPPFLPMIHTNTKPSSRMNYLCQTLRAL
jgi:hypothetical protein